MTYRERREARAEKRREWAASRAAQAESSRAGYRQIMDMIPVGQPILVGHHSEGRHRRDVARIDRGLAQTVEHSKMADRHEQAADEIERQLATSIYDDDPDAVERLAEKVERLEAKRDRMKAENAAFRKEHREELKTMGAYDRDRAMPHASYTLTNLGATIRNTRKRMERLARERETGPTYRMLAARFAGACDRCGGAVAKGDTIYYCRTADERVLCRSCGGKGA